MFIYEPQFIADSVVDFPFFDSSQEIMGWGEGCMSGLADGVAGGRF